MIPTGDIICLARSLIQISKPKLPDTKASVQLKAVISIAVVNFKRYTDRKSTRLNSSHVSESRMPSSA